MFIKDELNIALLSSCCRNYKLQSGRLTLLYVQKILFIHLETSEMFMPTDDGESGDSGSVSLRVDGHNFDLSSIVQLEVSQLEADQLAVRLHR